MFEENALILSLPL